MLIFSGGGLPPITPKKRNVHTEKDAPVVEDDDTDGSPSPFKLKSNKKKASKEASYQAFNQKNVEVKILPHPKKDTGSQPSRIVVMEYIRSNASNANDLKV